MKVWQTPSFVPMLVCFSLGHDVNARIHRCSDHCNTSQFVSVRVRPVWVALKICGLILACLLGLPFCPLRLFALVGSAAAEGFVMDNLNLEFVL